MCIPALWCTGMFEACKRYLMAQVGLAGLALAVLQACTACSSPHLPAAMLCAVDATVETGVAWHRLTLILHHVLCVASGHRAWCARRRR